MLEPTPMKRFSEYPHEDALSEFAVAVRCEAVWQVLSAGGTKLASRRRMLLTAPVALGEAIAALYAAGETMPGHWSDLAERWLSMDRMPAREPRHA